MIVKSRLVGYSARVDLAERLRDERERAGLTKTALAHPRYTVSYISQLEAGKRTPSNEALAYLAERLGVTPAFLGTGVPEGEEDRLRFAIEDARLAIRDDRHDHAEIVLLQTREDAVTCLRARSARPSPRSGARTGAWATWDTPRT